MISINLLPEDRRPVERTPLPRFLLIVGGVAGVCVEIVALGMLALRFPDMRQMREGIKVQQQRLQEQAKLVDQVQRDIVRIKQRGNTVEKLLQDRRMWAPILHRLTDPEVLPAAIWFRTVKLQEPRRRAGRGASEGMSLLVEGYAQGSDSPTMLQEVTSFAANLRKLQEDFPNDFEGDPKLSSVSLTKLSGGRDVAEDAPKEAVAFTVTIPLKVAAAKAPTRKK